MDAKLSVWTSYYVELSPEDAVLELKKHGIGASELSDEHGLMLLERGEPEEIGAAFRAFLAQQQFTMTQGHLFLRVRLCSDPEAIKTLLRWVRLYEAIGIENAVLHCDRIADDPTLSDAERIARNVERLLELQRGMEGMKLRICLENLSGIFNHSATLLSILDQLDPARFGICLDTGHLNLGTQPQDEFIRHVGKRLTALHIADNEGKTDQHMMPYSRGRIDFATIVRTLREVDYHGLFNLEIPGERFAPLPVLGYKLEYIRKCYDYLMQLP